jgi:hypothetical protein
MSQRAIYDATFYSSGTVVLTGDTGVIASPVSSAVGVIYPICFAVAGADMLTDETNDVTMDWYIDSAGVHTIGTTTFAQMTAGAMIPAVEPWPGDITLWNLTGVGAMKNFIPLPPYVKITHTLAGTTKSMSYVVKFWAWYSD